MSSRQILEKNQFDFEPVKEVVFLFIGIFGTMAPAMALVSSFAQSPEGIKLLTPNTIYWGAGTLSSFLDNAPTYLNFLGASMGASGLDINSVYDVRSFASGELFGHSIAYLKAISISSVFFGAMTYVGNGPNFMVKSIAESSGVKMPSFFGYILYYSLPILLPILTTTWFIFIR